MASEENTRTKRTTKVINNYSSSGNPVYFLGIIGAAVYYIQQADGFWMIVFGLLKALVWPAILVYQLLESLAS